MVEVATYAVLGSTDMAEAGLVVSGRTTSSYTAIFLVWTAEPEKDILDNGYHKTNEKAQSSARQLNHRHNHKYESREQP